MKPSLDDWITAVDTSSRPHLYHVRCWAGEVDAPDWRPVADTYTTTWTWEEAVQQLVGQVRIDPRLDPARLGEYFWSCTVVPLDQTVTP